MVHLGKDSPPQAKRSSSQSSVSCDPFVQNEVLFTPTTSACCCSCPKEHLFRQVSMFFAQTGLVSWKACSAKISQVSCWSDGNEAKHARATLYTECSWDQWGGTAVSPPVLPQFVCKTCVILSSKIVGVFLSSKIVCVFLSSELVANLLPSLEIAKTTWQLLAGKPKTRLSIEHNVSHPWYNNFVHLCNHFFVCLQSLNSPIFFIATKCNIWTWVW